MSRIPRPTTESTQDSSSRFGSLRGSMRKGFQSLRETLKKKDPAAPSTDRRKISAPIMKQVEVESGVNTVSVPAPLELPSPPAPPRQPVRSIRWEQGVHVPSCVSMRPGPAPRELLALPLSMRKFKQEGKGYEPNGTDADLYPRPLSVASHLQILPPKREERVPKDLGPQPLPLAAAPPRLPIRNPERNGIIIPPSRDMVADQARVPEPLHKFKLRKPDLAVRDSFARELPSPPPSEPRSSPSVEGEEQVEAATGIESTLDAAQQPGQEYHVTEGSTAAVSEVVVEKASPSSDAKGAYSPDAFTDRIQSITERMDSIKVKIAEGVENDEHDPVLEARGSRILEQVTSLKEEVANARHSKYILSKEEIASIESECQPRAPELVDVMMTAQEKVDKLVEEARRLAALVEAEEEKKRVQEEERQEDEGKSKPPPDAPTAPKAMLVRRAERAAQGQQQSHSWGRNGPPSSVQRQTRSGGNRSGNGRPNQRMPYNSQSMPRGGYRNAAPNPSRHRIPQSRPGGNLESEPQGHFRNGSRSGPPGQPATPYETWTMPRRGWPQNHGYNWPQRTPPMNPIWHSSSGSGAAPYTPGPPGYFPGYSPYGPFGSIGGYAP
ncbi:hypothetical protein DPSP01_009737 [Paraphaeosphaeria sporulosa]